MRGSPSQCTRPAEQTPHSALVVCQARVMTSTATQQTSTTPCELRGRRHPSLARRPERGDGWGGVQVACVGGIRLGRPARVKGGHDQEWRDLAGCRGRRRGRARPPPGGACTKVPTGRRGRQEPDDRTHAERASVVSRPGSRRSTAPRGPAGGYAGGTAREQPAPQLTEAEVAVGDGRRTRGVAQWWVQ